MVRKARRGVPNQCQSRVEVDRDALAVEIPGHPLDVSSQQIPRRRMHDCVDRLREIDDHRRLAPPQDIEGRQVAVHKLGVQGPPDLPLQLPPDPPRGPDIEIDIREARRRAITVTNERHAISGLDPLDRRRHCHAGRVQPLERGPLVRLPPRLEVLLAETCPLLYRTVFVTRAFAPDTSVEIVVAKAALESWLEPVLETR